jgi:hypothetical protein
MEENEEHEKREKQNIKHEEKRKKRKELLPRFELGLRDSKSRVLTTTP